MSTLVCKIFVNLLCFLSQLGYLLPSGMTLECNLEITQLNGKMMTGSVVMILKFNAKRSWRVSCTKSYKLEHTMKSGTELVKVL